MGHKLRAKLQPNDYLIKDGDLYTETRKFADDLLGERTRMACEQGWIVPDIARKRRRRWNEREGESIGEERQTDIQKGN